MMDITSRAPEAKNSSSQFQIKLSLKATANMIEQFSYLIAYESMIIKISYSSFCHKSTHLLFTTLRIKTMFIHIREITMREKTEQYEFNHTLQETIKIAFLSMNFLKTWQPYRIHIHSSSQQRGPLLKFQRYKNASFIKLSIPTYLRHSAQKINKEHLDQTSNSPSDQK